MIKVIIRCLSLIEIYDEHDIQQTETDLQVIPLSPIQNVVAQKQHLIRKSSTKKENLWCCSRADPGSSSPLQFLPSEFAR